MQIGKRTWKDHIGREIKKGKFQQNEIDKLKKKIQEVAVLNDLSNDELYKLLVVPQKDFKFKMWTEIAECLPQRSVKSIKNFCQRKYNPMNYQGQWSQDDIEQLIFQIQNIGPSWVQLSKIFNRTPENIRDKWKEIGGINNKLRDKWWTIEECIQLIRIIESMYKVKLIEFSDKQIKEKVQKKFDELEQYSNQKSDKSLLNYCVREIFLSMSTQNWNKKIKFNWQKISQKLQNKSAIDAKNKWKMIYKYKRLITNKEKRNILSMLQQIKKQNIQKAKDINFEIIKNELTANQNKNLLKKLRHRIKFCTNLDQLEQFCQQNFILKKQYKKGTDNFQKILINQIYKKYQYIA